MSSRAATHLPAPRMEPLARLPVFYALGGKRAVVAGGSAGAAWKAELLSAAGARVDVYAEAPGDEMVEIAAQAGITIHRHRIEGGDLDGAAMAIGAFESDADAARFAASARRVGVPVNVIDKPQFCDFAFGSIVNRSPMVIGISTDGAAPVFAQAIRARLESLIPRGFARWAEAARQWRPRIKSRLISASARRRFWERFTQLALLRPNDVPDDGSLKTLLPDIRAEAGSVTLVGAGPGDAELLTVRAVRALQSAEVILIDDLVSPQVLDFARREARKMMVGKTGHGAACRQSEINELMVRLAKAGKSVVRLKGGDPMIFGRAGEEIDACRAAGIAVDVVPGITAAQGAAARLLTSLTHRSSARRVQYVTGHDRDGKLPSDIDWHSLADPAATTVVYMPKKTLRELAERAIRSGLDPKTPAVVVTNATRPDEVITHGTISEIGNVAHTVSGPSVLIFGPAISWKRRAGLGSNVEPTAKFAAG